MCLTHLNKMFLSIVLHHLKITEYKQTHIFDSSACTNKIGINMQNATPISDSVSYSIKDTLDLHSVAYVRNLGQQLNYA